MKWRLTIKWTPRRGCVTRLKYRLSPRGQRGRGGFDSPISTGSMTIPCCCTNADISIGVDECVKEKEKLFKVFICIFFIFTIIGDYNFEDNLFSLKVMVEYRWTREVNDTFVGDMLLFKKYSVEQKSGIN